MSGSNERETKLVISATQRGMKNFKDTAKSVRDLGDAVEEQAAAAARGEKVYDQLVGSLKKLKSATDDLAGQQALIDYYNKLNAELDLNAKRALEASAAETKLRNELAQSEKTTKAQTDELRRLEKATDGARRAVQASFETLTKQSERLAAAGIDTKELASAQAELTQTARAAGVTLTTVGNNLEVYENVIQSATAAERELAAVEAFRQKAAEAAKLNEASQYVRFWTDALDRAQREEELWKAEAGLQKKAAEARELASASAFINQWTLAIKEAQAEEIRLKQLSSFRGMAANAEAGARDASAITGGVASGAVDSLRNSIQAIVDPAGRARDTLSGLEGEVERLTVEVGAADRPIREYQNAINDLGRVQRALVDKAELIDDFRKQKAAVDAATGSYNEARDTLLGYTNAAKSAAVPSEALAKNIRESENALAAAGRELENENRKLQALKTSLESAGIESDDLAKAQKRLETAADNTALAVQKLNKAQSGANSKTGRFLGLRPYELTNLSYQLNDVFTQLASGTSVLQTLAQQSGQIVQIIPSILTGIIKYFPEIAVGVGLFYSLYSAVSRVFELEGVARAFATELKATADGARYSAEQLTEFARAASTSGIALDEAKAALSAFVKEGVAQDRLPAFLKTAKDFALVTGKEVPDAAKMLATAFRGGYDSIAKLDDEYNFLTASQRENIRAMVDAGDVLGAQTAAFDIFAGKQNEAAENARGPWAQAWNDLGVAWSQFLDYLSDTTAIYLVITALDQLAGLMRFISGQASGATPIENVLGWAQDFVGKNFIGGGDNGGIELLGGFMTIGGDVNKVEELKKATDELAAAEAKLRAARGSAGVLKDTSAIRDAEAEVLAIREKIAKLPIAGPSDKPKGPLGPITKEGIAGAVGLPGEKEQIAYNDYIRKLQEAGAAVADLTGKERVLAAGRKAVRDAAEKGISNPELLNNIRITAEKNEQVKVDKELEARAKSKASAAEAAANALESRRKSVESALASALGQGANTSGATLEQRLDAITAKMDILRGKLQEAAAVGISQVGGQTLTDISAQIDANETLLKQEETKAFYKEKLKEKEAELAAIIAERTAQVGIYNEAVARGAMTQTEANEKIKALYAETKPLIDIQIQAIIDWITKMRDLGLITAAVYDSLVTKLGNVAAKSEELDGNMADIRKQLEQGLLSGAATAFDSISDALAGAIDGTISWSDALGAVRDAFLKFAADFLRQIAQMILQQAILNALGGGSGGGGGGGGFWGNIIGSIFKKHEGGVIGSGGPRQQVRVTPGMLAGMPTYHDGTRGVGLKHDEQVALLKKGEEVLTQDDPRHIANYDPRGVKGGAAAPPVVHVHNNLDTGDLLSHGLSTPAGEQAMWNFIDANSNTIKAKLG